jgi:hypothetical protein
VWTCGARPQRRAPGSTRLIETAPCLFRLGPSLYEPEPCLRRGEPCLSARAPCLIGVGPCLIGCEPCLNEHEPRRFGSVETWFVVVETWSAHVETWCARVKTWFGSDETWFAYVETLFACEETWFGAIETRLARVGSEPAGSLAQGARLGGLRPGVIRSLVSGTSRRKPPSTRMVCPERRKTRTGADGPPACPSGAGSGSPLGVLRWRKSTTTRSAYARAHSAGGEELGPGIGTSRFVKRVACLGNWQSWVRAGLTGRTGTRRRRRSTLPTFVDPKRGTQTAQKLSRFERMLGEDEDANARTRALGWEGRNTPR